MSVQKIAVNDDGIEFYIALSTDTKPTASSVPAGSKLWVSDEDETYINTGSSWVKSQKSIKRLAGERQEDSATASYLLAIPAGNVTRLDIDQTETLVSAAPCIVLSVIGNDGNTGYTALIDANATGSGATPKLQPNVADGESLPVYARFENGLCVDGESSGHDVTIVWWPL